MKRSKSIRLLLIGGLTAGVVADSVLGDTWGPVSAANVYTNNHYVPGAGYYHAPFRAWFAQPYNQYNPQTQRYFFGGHWETAPCQSITNLSSPTPEATRQAEAQRTDVRRGGFGGTSRHHFTHS